MKLCIGNLKFEEMEFVEMKRNTSNWSNFCILLRRAGLSASAGLSCCNACGFYRAMHFSAKRGIAIACCLSVRPSVTLVNCDHIGWNSSKIISPLVSM